MRRSLEGSDRRGSRRKRGGAKEDRGRENARKALKEAEEVKGFSPKQARIPPMNELE